MKKGTILTATLAVLLLASCSSEKTRDTQAAAVPPPAAPAPDHASQMPASQALAREAGADEPPMTKDGLPKDLVCMVNNAYMGKKQFPVQFEDKMYYGCCEMCVKTIKTARTARFALDPLTGKEVDKSLAFIALKPGSTNGEVLYFESEENYKEYSR